MLRSPLSSVIALLMAPVAATAAPAMEQWKEYAAASIAPSFDWYVAPAAEPPSLREAEFRSANTLAMGTLRVNSLGSDWGWNDAAAGIAPRHAAFDVGGSLNGRLVNANFSGTRLGLAGGAAGEFGISAVVARQHYATQGFGYGEWDGSYVNGRVVGVGAGVHEASTGSAVRLDWRNELPDGGVSWDVALQSRIEMDPFKAYRGVYSEPGDFDIPGYARVALEAPLSRRFSVVGEVQRVFYREIATFTSAALPTRFLSLLGDGASPDFAWRDLTVYAIETRLRDDANGQWSLRLASQQQPRPTSALLDRALGELYSDTNVALAYERSSDSWGRLRLGASYSPVTYFLGSSPYLQRGFDTGRQLEFEAQWSVPF
jgi:hypothetical protein